MPDTVYIVLFSGVDWNSPPPAMIGIGRTVEEALISAKLDEKYIHAWINETDLQIRAYFSVVPYDMTTSPPTKLYPPDLELGGGPYLGAN